MMSIGLPTQTRGDNRSSERQLTPIERDRFMTDCCPSWCFDRESGHRTQACDEDRRHYSDFYLDRPLELADAVAVEGGNWEPQNLTVFLSQQNRAAVADVHVELGNEQVLTLTLAEARALSDALDKALGGRGAA